MKMRKYKIVLEFSKDEETPGGAIPIQDSIDFGKEVEEVAKKYGMTAYIGHSEYSKLKENLT